jgi:hypothetical protein
MTQNVGEFVAERNGDTPKPITIAPNRKGRGALILSVVSALGTAGMAAYLALNAPIAGPAGPAGPVGPVNTTGGVCVSTGPTGYGYEYSVTGVNQAQDNNGVISCAFGTYVPITPLKGLANQGG